MKAKMSRVIVVPLLMMALARVSVAQDPGWPREATVGGARLVYYQPQVDDWQSFKNLDFRLAVSLTPAGGKAVVGVVSVHALTDVDVDTRTVLIHDLTISETRFPSLEAEAAAPMDQLMRTFLAPDKTVTISLDRLVASVNKPDSVVGVDVNNDPPPIFVSYGPAILVQVEGQPILAAIPETSLEFVVNANWPLFWDKAQSAFYLFTEIQWLAAPQLGGPWVFTRTLPKDMSKLVRDPQWAALKKAVPPPAAKSAVPKVFFSDQPAEVIVFTGQPVYRTIPGTELVYASNTDSALFVHNPTSEYYFLAAGRWFRAASLEGPWSYATPDLPADFARIPANSPVAPVRVSIPGTEEAKDAVLLAQIPTTAVVDPVAAAAEASATYNGEPQFTPIEGTSLSYATNTPDKVIKVGDLYYLCLQGVWFMSVSPQGPWKTAPSVPKEIYTIPPSSPVYNVTYVTQVTTTSGAVQSSYTAGYLGAFVIGATVGAIIANGSGYYHPPYVYYPPRGYPVYRPYPVPYGAYGTAGAVYIPRTGAAGVGRAVYGPYGGAAVAKTYNPYTGTYARGATAYGPYGSASAGQAYNPYTGSYAQGATVSGPGGSRTTASGYNPSTGTAAATRQGSSPYGQWGSSVVTKGNQAMYTQHASNARGTVGKAQTTSGGKAVGASGASGSGGAAKTSSGDMYAGKDGNVYKNTGNGWQKYDNGSWNTVTPPANAQPKAQGNSATVKGGTQPKPQSSGASRSAAANAQRNSKKTTGGTQPAQGSGASRRAPAKAGGYSNKTAGGGARAQAESGQLGGLQREAAARQRGAAESQRFQGGGSSRGGGGGGRGGGGGGRGGGGGGRRR